MTDEPVAVAPDGIAPPFGRYAQALLAPRGRRLLTLSGRLAVRPDGSVPAGAEAQARLILAEVDTILAAAGGSRRSVMRLQAFVTDRAHMAGYMAARDEWAVSLDPPPASTLVIVAGFTRPEFVVEVEATAVVPGPG